MRDCLRLFFEDFFHPGNSYLPRRSFIFCDICNPQAVRYVEMRRSIGRDSRIGRRLSDGRNWFEGSDEEAVAAGWVASEEGHYICPVCLRRMKRMRHALDGRMLVSGSLAQTLEDEAER